MKKWQVFITSSAKREIKKLPTKVRNFILKEFPLLVKENPLIGEGLAGPLSFLRSFHFSIDGNPYRIAYGLEQKSFKIIIHYAGIRSNFYERLRKHIGK